MDLLELYESFADMPFSEADFSEITEYGFLRIQTPTATTYQAFIEIPKRLAKKEIKKETKKIPAGDYICRQSEESQIEHVEEIFQGHIKDKTNYLAIEGEIFTGKYKINKPLHEVRVLQNF